MLVRSNVIVTSIFVLALLIASLQLFIVGGSSAQGELRWSKTFGGSGSDGGRSVRQTTDGGYIVACWTNSSGAGGSDVYLVKADRSMCARKILEVNQVLIMIVCLNVR